MAEVTCVWSRSHDVVTR